MKKLIAFFSALLLTASLVTAAETTNSLFSANELRLDTFATYQNDASWGYGIGATYYVTKNLGASLWAGRDNFDATGYLIEHAGLSLNYRVPVTDVFAPYVKLGTAYEAYGKDFLPTAGIGAEYRVSKRWGFFAEATYDFYRWDDMKLPEWKDVGVKLGVKWGF